MDISNQPTILVVEDDVATSEFFVTLLSLEGYAPLVAVSGRDALVQLRDRSVACVLLDRRLPDTDGLDVCREIRTSIAARVPIILLTADYSADLEAAAIDAGVSAYIRKPFQPDVLMTQIAALIGQ